MLYLGLLSLFLPLVLEKIIKYIYLKKNIVKSENYILNTITILQDYSYQIIKVYHVQNTNYSIHFPKLNITRSSFYEDNIELGNNFKCRTPYGLQIKNIVIYPSNKYRYTRSCISTIECYNKYENIPLTNSPIVEVFEGDILKSPFCYKINNILYLSDDIDFLIYGL